MPSLQNTPLASRRIWHPYCVARAQTEKRFGRCKSMFSTETVTVQVLGGKGGGKPGQAQCQGPNLDSVEDALQAAIEFAALKLE